ncbi:MAG: 3'(2'),5'-bisphosphate nucleotidase CysQ [Myxococcota bacterium]
MSALDTLVGIAREAAEDVARFYARHQAEGLVVELKAPDDPVTVADREVDACICRALERAFPGCGVIAEESSPRDAGERRDLLHRPWVFFVDPIDGTREFLAGNGEFCVMIGACHRGRTRMGVIVAPARCEVYAGEVGVAAWWARTDAPGASRRPLRVTTRAEPSGATMVVSRSRASAAVRRRADRLGIAHRQPLGSAGLKAVAVARGDADLYLHDGAGMGLWDACAGDALVRAAGGRVTDLAGARIDYLQPNRVRPELRIGDGVCFGNPVLHAAVLADARRG